MARVRNIGLPENDSERKAIAYLSKELPDNNVILTNMELPSQNGLPYEYDMIVIGDNAIYVIETKGYSGDIKGNAYEWELASGLVKRSPIPLLNKKTKIVADRIRRYSPMLSNIWVDSLVLMTDPKARVKVNDPQNNRIMGLSDCVKYIMSDLSGSNRATLAYPERVEDALAEQFRPLKRGKEIGEFRVLETLGRNELFSTVLAEHKLLSPPKKYALKVYNLNIYADQAEQKKHKNRILREANALLDLPPHPNIARANTPFPWQDDQIVLPVEWIEGRTLQSLLDQGQVDIKMAANIISQLCDVLMYIHKNGIVHRDLRPENVILPANGPLKLVNFDCARMEGSDLFTIATRVGRHLDERYVAPEVWSDPGTATNRSDIFSFGIILHELFCGTTPYQKIKEFLISNKVRSRIDEIVPSIDPAVDELFQRMCSFDPKDRLDNLDQVKETVQVLWL